MPAPSFAGHLLDNPALDAPSPPVISSELEAAAALSQTALARGTGDAYDFAIVALACSARREFAEADALFQRALALEPGNPSTLTSLAIHYRNQERNRDALLTCDEAIRQYPDYADAWIERGAILAAGGSNAAALASFMQATRLDPNKPAAHAGLASLAAREGDADAARRYAQHALQLDPRNAVAVNALASAELRSGSPEKARALLEKLLSRLHHPSLERSIAHSQMGDVCHRLSDYDGAFRNYSASNADFEAIHAHHQKGQLDNRAFVEALIAGFSDTDQRAWRAHPGHQPPNAAKRHIFLIGYPRSGTTLVENILASLPGVAALEERPTFHEADVDHIMGNADEIAQGLKRFSELDGVSLAHYRKAYWDRVVASAVPEGISCFVDMDPLKATRLPFIARLFPDARILMMRRDPRDVVWSCFRTNFAMSSGTLEYTSLERTARHYDAVMRLTERVVEALSLDVHIVHYHRLVQEFDAETQAMCSFAGLEWTDAVRNFDRTASQRGVSTASAAQVNRGLYDGTRQWEPYAQYLEPVIPILQPWLHKFGYEH